ESAGAIWERGTGYHKLAGVDRLGRLALESVPHPGSTQSAIPLGLVQSHEPRQSGGSEHDPDLAGLRTHSEHRRRPRDAALAEVFLLAAGPIRLGQAVG